MEDADKKFHRDYCKCQAWAKSHYMNKSLDRLPPYYNSSNPGLKAMMNLVVKRMILNEEQKQLEEYYKLNFFTN